jgi:hypothetical protein
VRGRWEVKGGEGRKKEEKEFDMCSSDKKYCFISFQEVLLIVISDVVWSGVVVGAVIEARRLLSVERERDRHECSQFHYSTKTPSSLLPVPTALLPRARRTGR